MRIRIALFIGLVTALPSVEAFQNDVFSTDNQVRSSANYPSNVSCGITSVDHELTLEIAVEHVLCKDPQTHFTWANAKAQAAQIGIARSAWLPKLDGELTNRKGHQAVDYDNELRFSDSGSQKSSSQGLTFSWLLFDFGQRSAILERSQLLLNAANASHDAALQNALLTASQLYYSALAAQRTLVAARQVENLATQNFEAADAKFKAGAAALSDKLQAQTALSQARLRATRDEGDAAYKVGLLALRMGIPPQAKLTLTDNLENLVDTSFADSIDELLAKARRNNPDLLAVAAQMKASKAAIDEVRAAGYPSLSLVGNVTRNHNTGIGTDYGDVRQSDLSIGMQLTIPLFEGFGRSYRVRDAEARYDASKAQMDDVKLRLAVDTWEYYQALSTETRSLLSTRELVEQARQSFEVVQGRYQSGIGSMLEPLNALTAYANAEEEHIQALLNWQTARLNLTARIGLLSLNVPR